MLYDDFVFRSKRMAENYGEALSWWHNFFCVKDFNELSFVPEQLLHAISDDGNKGFWNQTSKVHLNAECLIVDDAFMENHFKDLK